MTTNSTGRKNRIIGTVSFGGSAAAFFSASVMRMSRFSCASTRSACAERRAVALGLDAAPTQTDLHAFEAGALGEVLVGLPAVRQVGQFGGGQRQFLGERDRLRADLLADPLERGLDRHAGFDADQQQVERVREGALDRQLALRDLVLEEEVRQRGCRA